MDFDKVPHKRLLSKFNYYGIEYNTLKWIEDFLTFCTQTVTIDGVQSEKIPVTSDFPNEQFWVLFCSMCI
jgi:hypothetical protein